MVRKMFRKIKDIFEIPIAGIKMITFPAWYLIDHKDKEKNDERD